MRFISATILAALAVTACDKYLDVMPDNRAEVDTVEKAQKLAISAYPQHSFYVMQELASDNAMDNGSNYTIERASVEEAYLWEPVWTTGGDDAKTLWDDGFGCIAAANQTLQSIEDMGDPDECSAVKGEALMCRAYSYFRLANLFCLAYDPATASTAFGLPYNEEPETTVSPEYHRGTLEDLYAKINADIEAALPLINDEIYSVPKYHFNKKAAYAFATRFNLYYHKLDKVIEYAEMVLGSNPTSVMRNCDAFAALASNFQVRCNAYIDAGETANLLLTTAYSSAAYYLGPYGLSLRYGNARPIFMNEGPRAAGLWGTYSNLLMARAAWGYDQKLSLPKNYGYFEYTDKVQGIGYRMNVNVAFTTDETLLCRAEAYVRSGEYDLAVADINSWIYTHTRNKPSFTKDEIVDFYDKISYSPLHPDTDAERTVKKTLNPVGFTIDSDEEENLLHCILHLRRIETVHEGLRWEDIKRYGIEIAHNREGLDDDVLTVDDPRRAFQIPQDVISAGLEANPRND